MTSSASQLAAVSLSNQVARCCSQHQQCIHESAFTSGVHGVSCSTRCLFVAISAHFNSKLR